MDQRNRGFIANDWGCKCGDPNCGDNNVSDEELRKRYESVLSGIKQQLNKQLAYAIFCICIFLLSLLAISYLLTHQNPIY